MSSSEQQSPKRTTALSIITNWFLNSPSHGIRRINRSKTLRTRLFWSLIFLIFTALMCKFIHSIIEKFIEHPTKVNLSVRQYRESSHFPAITFCKRENKNQYLFFNCLLIIQFR